MVSKVLLKELNVNYTKEYLEDLILTHPNYPSLLSISETLDHYNIENLTIKINADKLSKIPLPFLVQFSDNGSVFSVIKGFSKNGVSCMNYKGKLTLMSKTDFFKKWTGICLLAETTEKSQEPDFQKRFKEKQIKLFLLSGLGILTLIWILISFTKSIVKYDHVEFIPIMLLALLYFIGLVVSVVLLWFEIDQNNLTFQSFCSRGKKFDCETILDSKYAKILNGHLSLGSIGVGYFFATLFYLLVNQFSGPSVALLAYVSFMTFPVVILSIYYQAIVVRKWCVFCIIIQLVLLLQIGIVMIEELYKYYWSVEGLPFFLVLFLMPILLWKLIKPMQIKAKKVRFYKRELKKLKTDPNVLNGLLVNTYKIKTDTKGLGISFENKSAKYKIIKVCNPFCVPCSKAHSILEELVDKGTINLQIIFTAIGGDELMLKAISHFLAVDALGDKALLRCALNDWYNTEKKDYKTFSGKYPINGATKHQRKKVEAMNKWCQLERIAHTPTVFINGYKLPKAYHIADLKDVLK